jgi:hypothetical protein
VSDGVICQSAKCQSVKVCQPNGPQPNGVWPNVGQKNRNLYCYKNSISDIYGKRSMMTDGYNGRDSSVLDGSTYPG